MFNNQFFSIFVCAWWSVFEGGGLVILHIVDPIFTPFQTPVYKTTTPLLYIL